MVTLAKVLGRTKQRLECILRPCKRQNENTVNVSLDLLVMFKR